MVTFLVDFYIFIEYSEFFIMLFLIMLYNKLSYSYNIEYDAKQLPFLIIKILILKFQLEFLNIK